MPKYFGGKMNKLFPIILALISTVITSFGAFFLKKASTNIISLYTAGGLFAYGMSFVIMIIALKYIDLRIVYAIGAFSFLIVFFLGVCYLGEKFTWVRLAGSIIIMLGIILMAR